MDEQEQVADDLNGVCDKLRTIQGDVIDRWPASVTVENLTCAISEVEGAISTLKNDRRVQT